MTALLLARVAVASLALVVARYRPALRPVAVALATLAALACALVYGLPPRARVGAWVVWPGAVAALAWVVWRGRGWAALALAWLAYSAAVALAPWSWAAHPLAYAVAIRAPHVAACGVALLAWASSRGPATHARAVAAVLALSMFVDVVAGAWAGPWALAGPLSWATWATCVVVCVSAGRAGRGRATGLRRSSEARSARSSRRTRGSARPWHGT